MLSIQHFDQGAIIKLQARCNPLGDPDIRESPEHWHLPGECLSGA